MGVLAGCCSTPGFGPTYERLREMKRRKKPVMTDDQYSATDGCALCPTLRTILFTKAPTLAGLHSLLTLAAHKAAFVPAATGAVSARIVLATDSPIYVHAQDPGNPVGSVLLVAVVPGAVIPRGILRLTGRRSTVCRGSWYGS